MLSSTDTTPPDLSCVPNVTTAPETPNSILLLKEGDEYNATDVSQPFSTLYDPPVNFPPIGGSLFPPGDTLVTLFVTDSAGNTAACNFTVTNPRA